MGSRYIIRTPVTPVAADLASATAAAATLTLAAVVGQRHVIESILFSYSAAPAAGQITIEDGGSVFVLDLDIIAAGPDSVPDLPLAMTAGTDCIITLASGGVGVTGKLNVYHRQEPG